MSELPAHLFPLPCAPLEDEREEISERGSFAVKLT